MFSCFRSSSTTAKVQRVVVQEGPRRGGSNLPPFDAEGSVHGSVEGSVHGSAFGSVHGLTNGMSGGKPQPSGFPLTAWLNQTAGAQQQADPNAPQPVSVGFLPPRVMHTTDGQRTPNSSNHGMPVRREIQSRRLSVGQLSSRSEGATEGEDESVGGNTPTRVSNADRANIHACMSKVPEFADFWEGRQQHRKKRLEQKGGGSPNSNDSPETVLAKQRANRGAGASGKGPKPATDYDNVAFPSLLQKGIAMSSKQLGSGDYGAVYEGVMVSTGEKVAVKCEPIDVPEKERLLEREKVVLNELRGATGVPRVMWFGRDGGNHVLVMELVGRTVESLYLYCQQRFSLKTVLLLADQLIARMEAMHRKGILHGDVKPDNMAMGRGPKANEVYLLDFGLARYYRDAMTLIHHPPEYGAGKTGNYRYSSLRSHAGDVAPSRRDDLESLAYVLIMLIKGSLPWQRLWAERKDQPKYAKMSEGEFMATVKRKTPTEILCAGLPKEFSDFVNTVRTLEFDEKPNYDGYRKIFRKLFDENKFSHDLRWDWVVRQEKQDDKGLSTPARAKARRHGPR